nr:hypothetical protein [Neorhizobium sp. T7_12]
MLDVAAAQADIAQYMVVKSSQFPDAGTNSALGAEPIPPAQQCSWETASSVAGMKNSRRFECFAHREVSVFI